MFAISSDEGHETTSGDIVVVDLVPPRPAATVFVTAAIERAPGISDVQADGTRRVAFAVGNDVSVATLRPAP